MCLNGPLIDGLSQFDIGCGYRSRQSGSTPPLRGTRLSCSASSRRCSVSPLRASIRRATASRRRWTARLADRWSGRRLRRKRQLDPQVCNAAPASHVAPTPIHRRRVTRHSAFEWRGAARKALAVVRRSLGRKHWALRHDCRHAHQNRSEGRCRAMKQKMARCARRSARPPARVSAAVCRS